MLKRRLQPLWVLVAALLAADLIAGTVAKRWIQEFGKIPAPVTSDTLASTPYTPPALDAQAKPDTVVKPKPASLGSGLAVIYKYPDGTSTTDSVRVLQRPYVATVKQPMVRGPKPETSYVTIIRGKTFTADSIARAGKKADSTKRKP